MQNEGIECNPQNGTGGDGACDVVVVEVLDRVSRDQEDVCALFKRLQVENLADQPQHTVIVPSSAGWETRHLG